MHRRVIRGRLPIRLALSACLTLLPLSLLTAPALAQPPLTGSGADLTQTQENMPPLLLVTRRQPKATAHDEAIRFALQDAAIGLMRNSGHYLVTIYSPSEPRIKNALLIHSVSSIDMSEPLQAEGIQHLASALGIRTILLLTPTFDKTGVKMTTQMYQNVGQDSWQLGVSGEGETPFLYGKRHLSAKEIIAVSIDSVAALLHLPSHLAADLNVKAVEDASLTLSKKPGKGDQAHNNPKTKAAPTASTDTQNPPDKTQVSTSTTEERPKAPVVAKPAVPKEIRVKDPKTRAVKNDKTPPGVKSEDLLAQLNNQTPPNGAPLQDGGNGRADVPTTPTVSHPNYETLADHYHDNHDMANTITWLRYAVNERPRDIPLRNKLILAYQERKMPDAALAEIARALQLSPNDSGLYRAYGNTLMNKGDVPGAEKAFRDAVRLNPDDTMARIALGDSLMLDNQYADAMDSYSAAQKADPRSPLPHRRLARALLIRAAADPNQYVASLEEIGKAQGLTPANDKATYQQDYGTLMAITESRLREMLDEVSGNFIAFTKGKQSGNDTLRALSDIQVRTDAISGYLDKAPPAIGQDVTQIHYQQAATQMILSITLFRTYVNGNKSDSVKQQMQDASAQSYQELDAAHKRLAEIRAALLPK